MKVIVSLRRAALSVIFLLCVAILFISVREVRAESVDDLIRTLHGRDLGAQLSAVDALGRIEDGKAVDALVGLVFIEAENWRVKIRAISVLGGIPNPRVADRLVTIFNNPFLNEECPAMKWYTAKALGRDFNRGTRAVDALIESLDYDNLLVREAVIQSLGKIGDPRAVPFLFPSLADPSFAIRYSAVKALESIGDPRAIPYLQHVAESDGDKEIKQAARVALDKIEKG